MVSTHRQGFFNDFFIFPAFAFTLNTNTLFAQIQDSRPKDFSGQKEQMPYNHLQIGRQAQSYEDFSIRKPA